MSSSTSDRGQVDQFSDLRILLRTLQTNSILHSFTQQTSSTTPSFHTFFLPHLPLLLTDQTTSAINNLRLAVISVIHLSSSQETPFRARYISFGRALLWALDKAQYISETVTDHQDKASAIEMMKTVKTIFHLVASLCYREWGFHHPSVNHPRLFLGASPTLALPSVEDPVYHPPPRVTPRSTGPSITTSNISKQINHEQPTGMNRHCTDEIVFFQTSDRKTYESMPSPVLTPLSCPLTPHHDSNVAENANDVQIENVAQGDADSVKPQRQSDFICNTGEPILPKYILPDACIRESEDGCQVPFELSVLNKSDDEIFTLSDLFTRSVNVSYPDNAPFPYIPVQNVRIRNRRTTNGITERDKFVPTATVEISSTVYETLINRFKEAYKTSFPEHSSVFLVNSKLQPSVTDRYAKLKIPVFEDSFVRLVYLLWLVEHPLLEALEMCQHDVLGCGLFKAEFVEAIEGTRIVLSLAGVIVERNLLNYGERIFELLNTGIVTDLSS